MAPDCLNRATFANAIIGLGYHVREPIGRKLLASRPLFSAFVRRLCVYRDRIGHPAEPVRRPSNGLSRNGRPFSAI